MHKTPNAGQQIQKLCSNKTRHNQPKTNVNMVFHIKTTTFMAVVECGSNGPVSLLM